MQLWSLIVSRTNQAIASKCDDMFDKQIQKTQVHSSNCLHENKNKLLVDACYYGPKHHHNNHQWRSNIEEDCFHSVTATHKMNLTLKLLQAATTTNNHHVCDIGVVHYVKKASK